MAKFKSVIEVLELLDKSNCRRCGEKTCMAFAALVVKGTKAVGDCPLIAEDIVKLYTSEKKTQKSAEDELQESIAKICLELQELDFEGVAEKIGANYDNGKISLKILGKDFAFDAEGKIFTDIHVNSWVVISSFNYVLHCQGAPLTGQWVPFRELSGGRDWYRLFGQQCEKPLKSLADAHPDLLKDMVELFSGKHEADLFQSDIAVILSPLPLVPMLICYWKAEDGMDSSLSLFFDDTAELNIGIEGLYLLGTGVVRMFEKLALQHG